MDLEQLNFIASAITKEKLFPSFKTQTTISLVVTLLSLGLLKVTILKILLLSYSLST